MIIKNIGTKIVNIGTTVLMPDSEATFSSAVASAPSIKALEELGFIKVEGEAEKVRTRTARRIVDTATQNKSGDSGAKAAENTTETTAKETSQNPQKNK